MTRTARVGLALALSACLLPGPATAGAPPDEAAQKQARQLTTDAALHYRLGRFREALDAYTKAYEVAQLPALLFNIGQCHKMIGNHERAVFFFEGFLRELPEAKSRRMVEALIAESKKELSTQKAAAEAQADAARRAELEAAANAERARAQQHASERPRLAGDQAVARERGEAARLHAAVDRDALGRRSRAELIAGGTLVGVGVVSLAAGLGLGLRSRSIAGDLEGRSLGGGSWDATAQSDYDQGGRFAAASTGLYVAGGVLAATGVVVLVLGGRDRARAQAGLGRGPPGAREGAHAMKRALVLLSLLALLGPQGACLFRPQLGEGSLSCGPEGQCPPGYACATDGRCYSGAPDGGLPDQGGADLDTSNLPALAISSASITEGASGSTMMSFTLTLASPSEQTVAVDFATADGNAVAAGSDYFTMSGTMTLLPGETTGTISVVVLGDTLHEADETFVINLTNPVNARIMTGQAVGTIVDDDAVPSFTISDVSLLEGNVGTTTVSFDVLLSEPSGVQATVKIDTADGTASAGSDYIASSVTLVYPPGTTKQTATVVVQGDTADEGLETFVVNLSTPSGATIADGQATCTLLNDDSLLPSLTIANTSKAEGNAGTSNATFTVTLNPVSAQTVTVNYTTAASFGTATSGVDYGPLSGQVTFSPGTPTQTISIPVMGDLGSEPDETFAVDLSGAVNANLLGQRGVGTIANDDSLPTLSIEDTTIVEGKNMTKDLTFTVLLSAASGQPVTVLFTTTAGTASAGSDFISTSGTLTLAAGATSASVIVKVKGDMSVEPDETFTLDLSAPTNATLADAQGVGTIQNDD